MKKEWAPWGPLILRAVLGIGFIYHGWPKLGAGHDGFVGMLTSIGIPAPGLMAWWVAILEVGGGLALLAGAFVPIVGGLLAIEMLVAIFKVHWASGFSFMNITGMTAAGPQFGMPGYEGPLLYLAGLLCLILGGSGAYSVDERRSRKAPVTPAFGGRP